MEEQSSGYLHHHQQQQQQQQVKDVIDAVQIHRDRIALLQHTNRRIDRYRCNVPAIASLTTTARAEDRAASNSLVRKVIAVESHANLAVEEEEIDLVAKTIQTRVFLRQHVSEGFQHRIVVSVRRYHHNSSFT